jgi:hypothetical protein
MPFTEATKVEAKRRAQYVGTMPLRLLAVLVLVFLATPQLPAPVIEESPPPTVAPKTKPKAPASINKAASMADQEVEVVLSESTQGALKHLKDYVEHYEKMLFAGKSDVKPDEILPHLKQALSTRFKNVSIANGSSAHRRSGLVMVFDLRAQVGSVSFTHNTIDLAGTFKDGNGKVLGSVAGSGKSMVPYPAFHTSFPKAVDAAFADFSRNLAQMKR